MIEILGIALALACALTANVGFLFKYRGARSAPGVDFRRPLWSGRRLFSERLFALGMLVAAFSWVFHVGALALVPISVVQAVLAGGIVLLAVMAERMLGVRIGVKQWLGVSMTAAGLALLGLSLPAIHGPHSQFSLSGMIAFEAGLVAAGALLIMGPRIGAGTRHHGVMLAAASGILFGVSDIAIKALTGITATNGLLGLLSPWLLVVIAAAVVSFLTSAKALQVGEPVPVIAITSTAANVVGILGGFLVFADPFPSSVIGIGAQVAAFSLVIVAAWMTPAPHRAVFAPSPA